ncbi:MAG TPA: TIGR01440 family protein [Virgibacillus sp.]|nr:TIGR01440 family protein [Virgibacillus sp.]
MSDLKKQVKQQMETLISEWIESGYLHKGDLFVIGCSTSEVIGEQIGTAGTEETAIHIYEALQALQQTTEIELVFQCCEHLNRALVMEKAVAIAHGLEIVSVIPHPEAGGSMASFAFKQLDNPVVVETVQAEAGIDIGETLIGMHLKQVAVPLRFEQKRVGNARLAAARTRPKLIGGERAHYVR